MPNYICGHPSCTNTAGEEGQFCSIECQNRYDSIHLAEHLNAKVKIGGKDTYKCGNPKCIRKITQEGAFCTQECIDSYEEDVNIFDKSNKAIRNEISARYDLIPGDVLHQIAIGMGEGAKKYGDYNWQKSRLTGVNGGINHALKHLNHYKVGVKDDESDDINIHLRNAIMNLMFEYWYNLNNIK